MELRDAQLKKTKALPAGSGNVTSDFIGPLKTTDEGHVPGSIEFLLSAPALTVDPLTNSATMTYDLLHSDNADGSSSAVLQSAFLVQTGAGGAGAAAATKRFRPPSDAKKYLGVKATNSATNTAAAFSLTLELLPG